MNGDFSIDSGVVAGRAAARPQKTAAAAIFCLNDEMAWV